MKKINLLLVLITLFSLTSCKESEKTPDGFKEVEGYEFPYEAFFEATKGIKKDYEWRNKMLFDNEIDSSFEPTLNPYINNEIELYAEYKDNHELVESEIGEHPVKHFKKEDGYTYYLDYMFKQKYLVHGINENGIDKFRFYKSKRTLSINYEIIHLSNYEYVTPILNIVEYDNTYSYFYMLGDKLYGNQKERKFSTLLYLLYNSEDLPYDVYIAEGYLFLMNQDERFSKAYLKSFMETKEVHYFNRGKIKNYWRKNRDKYPENWFELE